ncbi:MAG TPA: carboxymuconolactone decarboxylase family protein [Pyrinomonadaceae bacterium]|nr:carboxymuconolactone decarboxylase family protein [Pyrinomonadaceae bacterium]
MLSPAKQALARSSASYPAATSTPQNSFASSTTSFNCSDELCLYSLSNISKLGHIGKLALSDGAIPKKYKELMAIAVALTTQCPYCIEIHRKQAIEAGVTETELSEAVHVAAALRASGAITHGTHLFEG